MAAGLPVIVSDYPFMRKSVQQDGFGVAVDPADVDTIAKTIQDVLSDQQAALKMGENGRAAVLNKYNWGIEEEKLFALYKKLQKGLS